MLVQYKLCSSARQGRNVRPTSYCTWPVHMQAAATALGELWSPAFAHQHESPMSAKGVQASLNFSVLRPIKQFSELWPVPKRLAGAFPSSKRR